MTIQAKIDSDVVSLLWKQLRISSIEAPCWLQLSYSYLQAGLPWQANYTLLQLNRINPGLAQSDAQLAVAMQQRLVQDASGFLGQANPSGLADRIDTFLNWIEHAPGDWLTWLYLARLLELVPIADGLPWPKAADAAQKAVDLEPIEGESLHWLGLWRLNAGDADGSVQAFSQLLQIRPVRFGSMLFLGEALLRNGQREAAEKAFSRASLSNNVLFLRDLAQRVFQHNYWPEATDILNKALQIQPDSVDTLYALATIQWEVYNLSEAQQLCQRILELDPSNREVDYMLSALPGRMGDAKAHFEGVQAKYAQLQDPTSRLASSIAMASLYQDYLSAEEIADLHRELCLPIESALAVHQTNLLPTVRGERLKVGLVSGDFHRQHPVNIFMLPILRKLDKQRFEIYIYHTGTMQDDYTLMAKAFADHWIEASKFDDPMLLRAIRSDGVQLLMDLAGHTSSHRLGLFAMKAAPVQATFLGYPHSTGLSCFDWLIGDPWVSPRQHHHLFSEGIAQLPHSVFCWAPVDSYPLPPARQAAGPVVFGSFNNVMKLSPHTLDLWSRVLKAVPGSRLMLKAPSLRDSAVISRFRNLFIERQIDPARLEFQGPTELSQMMQTYGEIDIALDPTPYNGGTTTLQALWMGVPLVSLLGGNFVSRMGASFLHSLGRPEWLAETDDDYVTIASDLALQVASLRQTRPQLRQQMAASRLCDIDVYVRDFETLLERMWDVYERGSGERLLSLESQI